MTYTFITSTILVADRSIIIKIYASILSLKFKYYFLKNIVMNLNISKEEDKKN